MRAPHRATLALLLLTSLAAGCSAADAGTDDTSEDAVGTRSQFAGVFTAYGRGTAYKEGEIWELETRPDRTFTFHVQGLFGCKKYAGYDCPSSFLEGYSGYTIVRGTWSSRAGGITLQPTGDGLPADPIRLDMTFTGTTLDVQGAIAQRGLTGHLDVRALDAKSHKAKESDLDGTWMVDSPLDQLGSQPRLDDGTNLYVVGARHTVKIDAATGALSETRNADAYAMPATTFRITGAPDAQGFGLLLVENPEELPNVVPIASLDHDHVTFAFSSTRVLSMHRQTEPEAAIADALTASDVADLDATGISPDEVARQASLYPSKVDFRAAFTAALESFLTDKSDPESPLALAAGLPADDLCHRVDAKRAIRCLLDTRDAQIGILKVGETAEQGEAVDANWIITLSIPKLSDHGHWAVVDRSGVAAVYNYGFN